MKTNIHRGISPREKWVLMAAAGLGFIFLLGSCFQSSSPSQDILEGGYWKKQGLEDPSVKIIEVKVNNGTWKDYNSRSVFLPGGSCLHVEVLIGKKND
ncbi:hypothetical protein KGY73_03320 [bacterium]|nr:hypothetical protein [bacterium]